jgi:hypothetical protein
VAKSKRTPRQNIERAFHVSFKLPEQAAALLDAYRDQVLTEAAELVQGHALDTGLLDLLGAVDLILTVRTAQER